MVRAKKLGTLFIAALISLAGIGITYAGWIDTITVTGTVQTGTVQFEVTEYSGTWVWKHIQTHGIETHTGTVADNDINQDGIQNDDPDGYYNNEEYELIAFSYAYDQVTDEEVGFQFVNIFPCIDFKADFKFKIGTIPIFLTGTGLEWTDQKIDDIQQQWIKGIPEVCVAPTVTELIYDESGNQIWPSNDLVQLHPNEEYLWKLTIHIPQHNAYMNAYAQGSCSFDIIQWSDLCSKEVMVPAEMTVTFAHYGDDSYWDVTINDMPDSGGPWSPPLAEGSVINGWCVDHGTVIYDGMYDVDVYYDGTNGRVSQETYWPGNLDKAPIGIGPWDCVDYIINHKTGYDKFDVQDAIWYYVDGGIYPADSDAQALISAVNASAVNWINLGHPKTGELTAVLLDPGTSGHNNQYIIIEVDP
jgi:hypothetical protein